MPCSSRSFKSRRSSFSLKNTGKMSIKESAQSFISIKSRNSSRSKSAEEKFNRTQFKFVRDSSFKRSLIPGSWSNQIVCRNNSSWRMLKIWSIRIRCTKYSSSWRFRLWYANLNGFKTWFLWNISSINDAWYCLWSGRRLRDSSTRSRCRLWICCRSHQWVNREDHCHYQNLKFNRSLKIVKSGSMITSLACSKTRDQQFWQTSKKNSQSTSTKTLVSIWHLNKLKAPTTNQIIWIYPYKFKNSSTVANTKCSNHWLITKTHQPMLLAITKKQWKWNMIFTHSWSILRITLSKNKKNRISGRTCFKLNQPTMKSKNLKINRTIGPSSRICFLCHSRSSSLNSWDKVLTQKMHIRRQINYLLCWRRKSIDSIRIRRHLSIEIKLGLWSVAPSNQKLKIWYWKWNNKFNRSGVKSKPYKRKEIINSTFHLQWNIWSRRNSICNRLIDSIMIHTVIHILTRIHGEAQTGIRINHSHTLSQLQVIEVYLKILFSKISKISNMIRSSLIWETKPNSVKAEEEKATSQEHTRQLSPSLL